MPGSIGIAGEARMVEHGVAGFPEWRAVDAPQFPPPPHLWWRGVNAERCDDQNDSGPGAVRRIGEIMMVRGKKLEVIVDANMLARMKSVCDYLQLSPDGLMHYAIQQEITRQEIHMVKDEITMHEIDRNVLGSGQSLPVRIIEENDELTRHIATCQMCLKEFREPNESVEGPLFCADCLEMAHGGDFTGLEPEL